MACSSGTTYWFRRWRPAMASAQRLEVNRDAGDFFLGKQFLPKDPAKERSEKDMRLKELENGRLAMFAFSGIVTQAALTGKTWPFM
eukprot:Skav212658  [mRNA]  locus=scaffold1227:208964:209837:+ [translate_table: standard]